MIPMFARTGVGEISIFTTDLFLTTEAKAAFINIYTVEQKSHEHLKSIPSKQAYTPQY